MGWTAVCFAGCLRRVLFTFADIIFAGDSLRPFVSIRGTGIGIPLLIGLSICAFTPGAIARSQELTLAPTNGAPFDAFGSAVEIQGSRALVTSLSLDGAPYYLDVGGVHVFERAANGWMEVATLRPADPAHDALFGRALSLDGNRAAIGAPFAVSSIGVTGAVYLYELRATGWTQVDKLVGSRCTDGSRFGDSLELRGNRLVIGASTQTGGAHECGAVYVFGLASAGWTELDEFESPTPTPVERFGHELAFEGGRLAIGAPWRNSVALGAGAVFLYEEFGGQWQFVRELLPSQPRAHQHFGSSLALDEGWIAIGAPDLSNANSSRGCVSVIPWIRGAIGSRVELAPTSSDVGRMGSSLELKDGWLLAGAPHTDSAATDQGVVMAFRQAGSGWVEVGQLSSDAKQPGQRLGHALGLDHPHLLVGAPGASPNVSAQGLAHLFNLDPMPEVQGYCFGQGCPCGNESSSAGCDNSSGHGARLSAFGSLIASGTRLRLLGEGLPPGATTLLLHGSFSPAQPLGDGLLCLGAGAPGSWVTLGHTGRADARGLVEWWVEPPGVSGIPTAGSAEHLQLIYRDRLGPCNQPLNASSALRIANTP